MVKDKKNNKFNMSTTSVRKMLVIGSSKNESFSVIAVAVLLAFFSSLVESVAATRTTIAGPFLYNPFGSTSSIEISNDVVLIGDGSVKGSIPIDSTDASNKIILTYASTESYIQGTNVELWNRPVADLEFIEYSFKVDACHGANAACPEQFYLNVYTRSDASVTDYYSCRYDLLPSSGGIEGGDWTTVRFDLSSIADTVPRGDTLGCPVGDNTLQNAATAGYVLGTNEQLTPPNSGHIFSLNMGDTSLSDNGLTGYFDKVVIKLKDENEHEFDLGEPHYVDASVGNDNSDGSIIGPFQSIRAAIDASLITASVMPSDELSLGPTYEPSVTPSETPIPTYEPSMTPSDTPSNTPTRKPTRRPTKSPTRSPSHSPSMAPSLSPTESPTKRPTKNPTLPPVAPVTTFMQNTICGSCNETLIVDAAQQEYNSLGFDGAVKVIATSQDCTTCPGALARTISGSVTLIFEVTQFPTPEDPENVLEASEIINFFNSKVEIISEAVSQKLSIDIAVQEDAREIEAPSTRPSQSPAPTVSQLPSLSLSPTQKYQPSTSPTSSPHPTSSPTTQSSRTFQIISSLKFDDSGRDFCLNAMKFEVGRTVKMRPCRNGFRKQMWYLDDYNHLRLRASPDFCLTYINREVTLGKCLYDGRTERARFIYDKSRGVVLVRKRRRDLYLGIKPDDKYGPVQLFLEGENVSLTKWLFF